MFESMVRRCPDRTCFTYVDEDGSEVTYSYREMRLLSAAIARSLRDRGVGPDDHVAVDLPNCPAYVFLILAAAYGGFSLVALNNRLTEGEKLARLMELERVVGSPITTRIDKVWAERLIDKAMALLSGESASYPRGRTQMRTARPTFTGRAGMVGAEPRTTKALGRAPSGRAAMRRRSEIARQDAVEAVIHFAEHAAHIFDRDARAVVMFTSGTTGRAKAVPLTWDNVCRSAEVFNSSLSRHGEGLWQAALPLYHVGGFQVIVRSLLNCCPFVLYHRFDAERVLADGHRKGATHISVVDKMLQDMLATGRTESLLRYGCILLGGGATNPSTLDRVRALRLRVFSSYGMTETASLIAHAQVTSTFQGGLRLLPSYKAHIVDPGADGFGRLAVKGPGLFKGYLNAQAAYTVDGYFLTGDTAALYGGLLYVKERTDDMFVSGGENVYPAEIREKILRIPGVKDAHVFGAVDERWGRRPVAFVERETQTLEPSKTGALAGRAPVYDTASITAGNRAFSASVQAHLRPQLSKLYLPKQVYVLDEFPRSGVGKINRSELERQYGERIEVARVTLYHIRLPFINPFKTAKGTLTQRESIIVEVTDHEGRTGLGECVSFPTDWYLPETLGQDTRILHDVLAPLVLHETFLHPREVSLAFASDTRAEAYPMACGALEPALWDLYGKIVEKPLWQLVGEAYAGMRRQTSGAPQESGSLVGVKKAALTSSSCGDIAVPAGAVISDGSVSETVAAARRCAAAGYSRIKLKIAPGSAARVRAVRAALPQVMLTLDANQSFTERDVEELRELDSFGAAWIEEPLDPRRVPAGSSTDIFVRLARLQHTMRTPICLDESIARPFDMARALSHPELRCYALKIGKLGGIQPSVEFARMAQARGIDVWMGGMYDTGISKLAHAAFEALPNVNAPGDIGATSRYFSCDITTPPYTAERGFVTLNREGHAHGLGCDLDRSALAAVLVDRIEIDR
ncbi:AMP-binding protein [Eggerthella sp. YY7918]|uniref:AMP-binding protein n=1 Tax=Eggerthella sp. (strain YY7918) TaxID=502558 RepID=UPI001E560F05|nr:AMP-binding protein [Eggerthella sp. YY7918]